MIACAVYAVYISTVVSLAARRDRLVGCPHIHIAGLLSGSVIEQYQVAVLERRCQFSLRESSGIAESVGIDDKTCDSVVRGIAHLRIYGSGSLVSALGRVFEGIALKDIVTAGIDAQQRGGIAHDAVIAECAAVEFQVNRRVDLIGHDLAPLVGCCPCSVNERGEAGKIVKCVALQSHGILLEEQHADLGGIGSIGALERTVLDRNIGVAAAQHSVASSSICTKAEGAVGHVEAVDAVGVEAEGLRLDVTAVDIHIPEQAVGHIVLGVVLSVAGDAVLAPLGYDILDIDILAGLIVIGLNVNGSLRVGAVDVLYLSICNMDVPAGHHGHALTARTGKLAVVYGHILGDFTGAAGTYIHAVAPALGYGNAGEGHIGTGIDAYTHAPLSVGTGVLVSVTDDGTGALEAHAVLLVDAEDVVRARTGGIDLHVAVQGDTRLAVHIDDDVAVKDQAVHAAVGKRFDGHVVVNRVGRESEHPFY